MGMYTELHVAMEIRGDAPSHVIQALEYMVDTSDTAPRVTDDHPLFSTARWEYFMQSDSYYFPATTHQNFRYDKISDSYFLTLHTNFKNYNDEISQFLDWIKDYNAFSYTGDETEQFVGYFRYEEDTLPTLILFRQNQDKTVEVVLKETG